MSDGQRRRVRAVLMLLVFVSVAVLLALWAQDSGGPEAFVARFGIAAPLVTVPMHAVISITPFPSELFVLASGTAYGWLLGGVFGWMGWTAASLIQYGLASRTAIDFDVAKHLEKLPARLRELPVGHPLFLILGRQVPFGFHVVNVLAGVKRISVVRFAICAGIGSIPGAVLYAGLGAGIQLL